MDMTPLIMIEMVLFFGGTVAFIAWQLYSVRKAQADNESSERLFFRRIDDDEIR